MSAPVPPAPAQVIPAAMQANYSPTLVVSLFQVDTPSGQTIEVLGQAERDFYFSQRAAYQAQNKFTNTSDLLDLDRLLFLELLIYRATSWLGRGQNYDGMTLSDRDEVTQRRSLKENSTLISVIKNDLGLTRTQRDRAAYECHSDDTEVLTEHGWKLFADVQPGERVATRSSDGVLEYEEPTAYHVAPFDGELVGYESSKINFLVTPNHRMLIEENGIERFRPVGDFNGARHHYVLPKTAVIDTRSPGLASFYDLPEVKREDFASLLGFWLAEGVQSGTVTRFSQCKPRGIAWTDALLQRLGWVYRRYEYPRVIGGVALTEVIWTIRSSALNRFLMACVTKRQGRSGGDLHIPDEVFTFWTRQEMEALLDGLMTGDGTRSQRDGDIRYYTNSWRLASDVQRLLAHLGLTGWAQELYPAGARMSTGVVARLPGYGVSVRRASGAVLYPDRLKRVPYVGMVHCLSVPNGTLLTRRAGITLWSGNSVGTYITLLKQRAKEFGVHREKQVSTAITLIKQLFAIVGAYDRSDETERHKIGFETSDEILDWVREVMVAEFDHLDDQFIAGTQRYWTTS